jgi:DNA invertase Pin-like site-specific DNA recombinase
MNIAIYVRLSEEDRNKTDKTQDSESIVNQRNMLTEYAVERGWDVFDVYVDEDYSGSDAARPAFNRMINDARERRFKVVLCKSLSRFARDVAMVETYINGLFLDWGIRFISLSDYADSSQKGTRKNIQINSLVNQWYLEDLSDNIKSVMTHKKKQGQFVGAFAPYGYIKDPDDKHKLIIDAEAAEVVKRIFAMYLDGCGLNIIAKQLNAEGIPCPSKYRQLKGMKTNRGNAADFKWSDHTVWHITRNPNYTGNLTQCRYGKPSYKSKSHKEKPPGEWVIVENTHEAIISKADYDKVQEMKKTRGAYSRSKKRTTDPPAKQNAFAGLLKCRLCGHSMVLSTSSQVNGFARYFRCTAQKSRLVDCDCAMVKYDIIEGIITERIKDLIGQYCDFSAAEKRTLKKEAQFNKEISALEKAIDKNLLERKKLDKALSDSYIDKSAGAISLEVFSAVSSDLESRRGELASFLEDLKARIKELQNKQNNAKERSYIAEKYKDFSELTREIAGAFIDTVYIGERDKGKYYEEPVVIINKKLAKRDFYIEIVWNI